MSYSPSVEPRDPRVAKQPMRFSATGGVAVGARGRGSRRWWILGGFILAGAAGAGIFMATRPPTPVVAKQETPSLTVSVAPVEPARMGRILLIAGSLAARDELTVGSEAGGLAVMEVMADIGDKVRQGQVLARFNDSLLRADLMQKEASLREAEALAAEAAANVRRAEELAKSGHVSGRELDNKRAAAATAQARVAVAAANREQAVARLRQTEIRAPANGTITTRSARLGSVMSTGGVMFGLIRDDMVELVAEVPEVDLLHLQAGQPVALSVDGDRERSFDGIIRLVEPKVDPRTRMGAVRIDVPPDPALKPGMFARGRVSVGQIETLTVPENTVVSKDGRPVVFIVDAENRAQPRQVETGPREGGRIALLSGVTAGDRVVVAGAGFLKAGDLVGVADAAASADVKPLPSAR